VAQVNDEFESPEIATQEATQYAHLIGQLPTTLRQDVKEVWIHKGTEPFGGGNQSILIHTGQAENYIQDGILEETLVHEACHTSLDASHATSAEWIKAQELDTTFISTYAQENPTREDIAESFLLWMAVRYRLSVLSEIDITNITQAIPHRLKYFDSLKVDLYPFEESEGTFTHQPPSPTLAPPTPFLTNRATHPKVLVNVTGDKSYDLLGRGIPNNLLFKLKD